MNDTEIRDWDAIAANCDEIVGLDSLQRERVKQAFSFLKSEFGERFLVDRPRNELHTFFYYLFNHVAHTRLWFADFADMLREVKHCRSYSGLLRRLKNEKDFSEAESVLEAGIKLLRAGLDIEFDSEVSIDGKVKVPDIKISNAETNEVFYCEVSVSYTSQVQQKAFDTEITLFNAISVPGMFLEIAGKVHKTLEGEELAGCVKIINRFANEVASKSGCDQLLIDGVITLGVAVPDKKGELINWAGKHGCRVGSFDGPPFNVNELRRMENKFYKEQQQLPPDVANLVMIRDDDFFYGLNEPLELLSALEKTLYAYDHVLALIIHGGYTGTIHPAIVMSELHMYVQKSKNQINAQQYLMVWNHRCKKPVSPLTVTKIFRAIREF